MAYQLDNVIQKCHRRLQLESEERQQRSNKPNYSFAQVFLVNILYRFVGLPLHIVTRLYNPLGGPIKSAIRAARCGIWALGCHRWWRTVAHSADLYMVTKACMYRGVLFVCTLLLLYIF